MISKTAPFNGLNARISTIFPIILIKGSGVWVRRIHKQRLKSGC